MIYNFRDLFLLSMEGFLCEVKHESDMWNKVKTIDFFIPISFFLTI
jgi:hypothetical protein